MRKMSIVSAILVISTFQFAEATIVQIPLPDLNGRYFPYEVLHRHCLFEVSPVPSVVHGASLRLVGTVTIRPSWCELYPGESYPEPFDFSAQLPDPTTEGAWGCSVRWTESNGFDVAMPWSARAGASWDFLQGGTGEISLVGGGCPILDGCWEITECSEAFVEQAFLVLDAEFPIPVQETTWGRVKALFDVSN